jgi:hypothetical protein
MAVISCHGGTYLSPNPCGDIHVPFKTPPDPHQPLSGVDLYRDLFMYIVSLPKLVFTMLMHFVARLYTNTQTGPEPSYDICLIQASLLYGAMPMSTVVCFTLVYHVWTTVYVSKTDPEVAAPWHKLRLILVRFLRHFRLPYENID